MSPRFPVGMLLATPAAMDRLGPTGVGTLLGMHAAGDWGVVCDDDKRANEEALATGDRVLSAYVVGDTKFYVITEADRSHTTLMMADEY